MHLHRHRHRYFAFAASLVALGCAGFGAVRVFPTWALIIAFWFACVLLQYRVPTAPLTGWCLWFHRAGALGFPIAATMVKRREVALGYVESSGLSNRVQHFGWAFCTVAVFAPLLVRWARSLHRVEAVAIAVGLVAVLGNLTEVVEWRRGMGAMSVAYSDTMKDLVMNTLGALVASSLLIQLGMGRRASVAD